MKISKISRTSCRRTRSATRLFDESENTYRKLKIAIFPAIIDDVRTEIRESRVARNFLQTILGDPIPGEMRL